MKDPFRKLYNRIIKEDIYDYNTQRYWHERETQINDLAKTECSQIQINSHNEFEAHLTHGSLYSADLTGEIDPVDGTVRWEISETYNGDEGIGLEINGETEGERHAKSGQTINMVLDILLAEFQDAFEERWEEWQEQNEQYQSEWNEDNQDEQFEQYDENDQFDQDYDEQSQEQEQGEDYYDED